MTAAIDHAELAEEQSSPGSRCEVDRLHSEFLVPHSVPVVHPPPEYPQWEHSVVWQAMRSLGRGEPAAYNF
ncbi:MAG: hypothetical protein K0U70_09435 [Actinomycetia bacterium]|nr:hypothetical protein [Actinomycetes bacterium]